MVLTMQAPLCGESWQHTVNTRCSEDRCILLMAEKEEALSEFLPLGLTLNQPLAGRIGAVSWGPERKGASALRVWEIG